MKEHCAQAHIRFVFCTGKQCERVENIVGDLAQDTFIVGDSATRTKYNGSFIYNATIDHHKGQEIIQAISEIDSTQTILGCTASSAYVLNHISEAEKRIVHGSYQEVTYINDFSEVEEDF